MEKSVDAPNVGRTREHGKAHPLTEGNERTSARHGEPPLHWCESRRRAADVAMPAYTRALVFPRHICRVCGKR